MAELPLKTTARSLFAWQRKIAVIISLFVVFCVAVWCFTVLHSATTQFEQIIELSIHENPDITPPELDNLLSKLDIATEIYYIEEQKTLTLNTVIWFDWQSTTRPFYLSSGQSFQVKFIVLSTYHLFFIGASLSLFWFIVLSVLWSLGKAGERNLSALERKARRMQIASRHEITKHPSLFTVLDNLLDELNWARQEQSRVDKFIRIQTFLDPETGIGNRIYFNNRLEALLNIEEQIEQGVVVGIRINELAEIEEEHGNDAIIDVLSQFTNITEQALQRYNHAIFARYSHNDLAIIIANISIKEIEQLCNHLVRSLAHVRVPKNTDADNLYHIGVSTFKSGDHIAQVLREVDMAIRSAELQGPASWFMYQEEDNVKTMTMGSLQWRTLLENKLNNEGFLISFQAVMKISPYTIHHQEIVLQLQDNQGKILPSNLFMPMAHKCGLAVKIDKQIISKLYQQLVNSENPVCTSINISSDALLDKSFRTWFTTILAQDKQFASQIIIEISEYAIVNYIDELSYFIQQLDNLSTHVLVDQVGQYVTASNYIKQLPIRYLKLHPSIVKNIHNKSENQLFIRSLQGSCAGTGIKIFAYGVETLEEFQEIKHLGLAGVQGSYNNFNQD
ncbi:EAL domain-containing protein [Catenovulum sp. 2E275]|uniref:EAL domain-containing protein n=1 Tax=Catenovulum sp. 2E275 TaxID=2980497 RepID=UPI0021D2FF19|nr:EAL domain-containing protein [Catenovulum sp. 2E275]MCU4675051.1 EAL domain-containing protein [Catenovulum sp. 2E275]